MMLNVEGRMVAVLLFTVLGDISDDPISALQQQLQSKPWPHHDPSSIERVRLASNAHTPKHLNDDI